MSETIQDLEHEMEERTKTLIALRKGEDVYKTQLSTLSEEIRGSGSTVEERDDTLIEKTKSFFGFSKAEDHVLDAKKEEFDSVLELLSGQNNKISIVNLELAKVELRKVKLTKKLTRDEKLQIWSKSTTQTTPLHNAVDGLKTGHNTNSNGQQAMAPSIAPITPQAHQGL